MKCGPNGLRWMDGDGSVPQSKGSHLIQTFFFPIMWSPCEKMKYLSPIKMSECRLLRKLRNKNSGGFYVIDVSFKCLLYHFKLVALHPVVNPLISFTPVDATFALH